MKNKSLIIIVISLFFIAGIFGAEKRVTGINNFPTESERLISGVLTPYSELGSRIGRMDTYRPIYIKKLDPQKNE
tara:strand:- start:8914 stop:9138 length:225 start_codon:yes stop_codon:yes gene_type:complete